MRLFKIIWKHGEHLFSTINEARNFRKKLREEGQRDIVLRITEEDIDPRWAERITESAQSKGKTLRNL